MNTARLGFIDWMKCLGMAVIVYGHTAGPLVLRTEPFNPKQLGVAFFLFALGFSLSRERRPTRRVLFNRLFDVYVVGIVSAAVVSLCTWIYARDLAESNYLPFLLGVNVCFNWFPANPTTWYIGTYVHILLLWAFILRPVAVRPWMLAASLLVEVPLRAALIQYAGSFVAYMCLTNWMTVFLLGIYIGQTIAEPQKPRSGNPVMLGTAAALCLVWLGVSRQLDISEGFPFAQIRVGGKVTSLLASSCSISLLYLTITWLVFETVRRLPDPAIIRFFARNTLFVFIAHMPLLYLLVPYTYPWMPNRIVRALVNMVLYYVVLAAVSEMIFRAVPLRSMRQALADAWDRLRHGSRAPEGEAAVSADR